MTAKEAKRPPSVEARVACYCFGFCGFAAIVVGLAFTSLEGDALGGFAMVVPILLGLPMVLAALVGVMLSLFLRKPRGLLLLAGLTVLVIVFLTQITSDLAFATSMLVYGIVALSISGYLLLNGTGGEPSDSESPSASAGI